MLNERKAALFALKAEEEIIQLALELGAVASVGAQMIVDEIKASMPNSEIPAEPGQPPHSPGPLRDSWHTSSSKSKGRLKHRERRRNAVVAYAFSQVTTRDGESLNEILDEGRGPIHPHPFIRAAMERAERRFASVIGQEQAQMNAAARQAR